MITLSAEKKYDSECTRLVATQKARSVKKEAKARLALSVRNVYNLAEGDGCSGNSTPRPEK